MELGHIYIDQVLVAVSQWYLEYIQRL